MLSNNEIEISKNIHKWEEVIVGMFPKAIPDKCIWYDEIDILNILFSICAKNLNSIYTPEGESSTLYGVDFAKEHNCLELIMEDELDVIRPKKLSFHFFDNSYLWSYFRIETNALIPLSSHIINGYSEMLNDEEDGEYNRYVKKSSFLIFPKESPFKWIYNKSFNILSQDEMSQKIEELMMRK